MSGKKRDVVFYKNHFNVFFIKQRQKVRDKIIWTFDLIEQTDLVPEKYLKHLEAQKGFLKSAFNMAQTSFASSAFLMKENL